MKAAIWEYFNEFVRLLKTIQPADIIDIVLVTLLVYKVIQMIRSTSTARIAKAVVLILLLSWATGLFELHVLNYLMSRVLDLGLIALLVLFQPELRRGVEKMGGASLREIISPRERNKEINDVISQTVSACEAMSREKVGALMVFERSSRLDEYFKTGTIIDGRVSDQLIRNIFFPKAALHDGAMVVRDGRVTAAGCVLPLSGNQQLSADLGTRHRAGVGISEVSDAVVVIVSEETGTISVAVGGMLKRHLAPQTLERLLLNELAPGEDGKKRGALSGLWSKVKSGKDESNEK
ncbi:MAG: diadenylate cyclase CdaA [Candidatus Faecousia sp.]|nr:diadenylate cyclase CdaA [Bacillota bacterium]MDY4219052.1 diadenylate cyclase CdaA [Candidatus Faecousia sp.]